MILKRSVASLLFWLLLFPVLRGQDAVRPGDPAKAVNHILLLAGQVDADTAVNLAVPNFFSPNGDGINDYFSVPTDGNTQYEFSIFSRAGIRIYYSRSPRIFWDGRSADGLEYPPGIYYYVIEGTGTGDPVQKPGFLHLFR